MDKKTAPTTQKCKSYAKKAYDQLLLLSEIGKQD